METATLGSRGFSRVRQESSVLAEGRHIFGHRPKPRGDGAKRCEREEQRRVWGRGVSGRFYTSLLSRVVNSSTYLT